MKKIVFGAICAAAFAAFAVDSWRIEPFELDALDTFAGGASGPVVVSPVALAAEICIMGEAGTTALRADMAERMKLMSPFDTSFASIRASYYELNASNQTALALAPSIWSDKARVFRKSYLHILQESFGAEAGVLASPVVVNAWTAAMTDGRVPEMLSAIPPASDIALCCAVAFEGVWPAALATESSPGAFRCEDGPERPVKYAAGSVDAMRITRKGFSAYICRFASPGLRFVAILPDEGVSLAELRKSLLTPVALEEIKAAYRIGFGADCTKGSAKLRLPQFEAASNRDSLEFIKRYGTPESGYDAFGRERKLTSANVATVFRIDGRGYSLTPGVTARRRLEEARAREGEKPSERYHREEAAALAARTDFEIDLSRPFVFAVWDETSNTIPVIGEYK